MLVNTYTCTRRTAGYRRLRLAPTLAAAVGLMATAAAHAQFTAGQIPVSGASIALFGPLDTSIKDYMAAQNITAVTVAIMNSSRRILYERGFGWQDYYGGDLTPIKEDTVMRIASVTKPITAAAIQKLITNGVITQNSKVFACAQTKPNAPFDKNDPNTGILPTSTYFPWDNPGSAPSDTRYANLTVQHLIEHRGGFDSTVSLDPQFSAITIANVMGITPPPPGPVNTVNYMLSRPLDYAPGTSTGLCSPKTLKYCYSNFGFMLLGLIIEQVSGKSYMEYVDENFLTTWGGSRRDMFPGRTFKVDQDPREPVYEPPSTWLNVFCSTSTTTCNMPSTCSCVSGPYGGWEQEVFLGHGDLVTNTTQILNYASRYVMFSDYSQNPVVQIGTPLGSVRSGHVGSLPGTNAIAQQRSDNYFYAIIVNQRDTLPDTDPLYQQKFVSDIGGLVGTFINDNFGFLPFVMTYATDNWVDFASGSNGTGTFTSPKNNLTAALTTLVQPGGRIKFKPGSSNWTGTINGHVKLDAPIGSVRIGQ